MVLACETCETVTPWTGTLLPIHEGHRGIVIEGDNAEQVAAHHLDLARRINADNIPARFTPGYEDWLAMSEYDEP